MDILLLNPNHQTHINSFPWGGLAIGSYLTKVKNLSVKILDASCMAPDEFQKELDLALEKTRIVGLTCFSSDAYFIKSLVDDIKRKRSDIKIIVGGPHAVLRPEQCARYSIDFVAYADGEETVFALIEVVKSGGNNYDRIPGVVYKDGDRHIKTQKPGIVPYYDMDYELLSERKRNTYSNYMQVLTGRGCSFQCTFCYNAICGHKWVGRDIESVVRELSNVVAKYNPRLVYFRDENFFHSKKRILRFIESYRDMKFSFHWRATCRANYFTKGYINEALVKELEDINCETMKFGFESGSQRVLDYLKKGIKIESCKRVVECLSRSKIVGNYSFLIGVPGETVEEYRSTLKMVKFITETDPKAEIIGPQFYRIYPGGELYQEIMKNYEFKEPSSFEEWAELSRGDEIGFGKNVEHPWIHRGKLLARYADVMMLLYRKPFGDLISFSKLPAMPFAALAKGRVKTGWYGLLYDMKIADHFFKNYVKRLRAS
ncbi:MAG: B12-binding domain-containing radical SAM protein [Syntrophales bacterium LBB04]|nr:B12-binding domain-containing radical SAM protein [Syntrophales bacterium LBB04]